MLKDNLLAYLVPKIHIIPVFNGVNSIWDWYTIREFHFGIQTQLKNWSLLLFWKSNIRSNFSWCLLNFNFVFQSRLLAHFILLKLLAIISFCVYCWNNEISYFINIINSWWIPFRSIDVKPTNKTLRGGRWWREPHRDGQF